MKLSIMIETSLFVAIMAILSLMPAIPLAFSPVPLTMQSFGVMLSGSILGRRHGGRFSFLSQFIFLALVLVGLPLLPGGRGGMSVLVMPSAGFLIGFSLGSFLIGSICYRLKHVTYLQVFLANLAGGLGVVYLLGVPVLALYMNISLLDALRLNLVFIPLDLFKVLVASIIAVKLYRSMPALKRKLA